MRLRLPAPQPSPASGGGQQHLRIASLHLDLICSMSLKHPHARTYLHGWWLHAALAADGICPRHHARGDPRRRPRGRRLFRGAAAAQPFPCHLRRGRLQRGLGAGLCARPWRARRGGGKIVRRPDLHAAAGLAGCAADRRLAVHAAGHEHFGARLFRGRRTAQARDRADPDHLSLSAADHAGDALRRHAQRDAALCRAPRLRRSSSISR